MQPNGPQYPPDGFDEASKDLVKQYSRQIANELTTAAKIAAKDRRVTVNHIDAAWAKLRQKRSIIWEGIIGLGWLLLGISGQEIVENLSKGNLEVIYAVLTFLGAGLLLIGYLRTR